MMVSFEKKINLFLWLISSSKDLNGGDFVHANKEILLLKSVQDFFQKKFFFELLNFLIERRKQKSINNK